MADLIGGNQGTLIVAAGTTILSNIPVTLKRVVLGGTFIGSVELYDSTTAAGTAAGNLMYTQGIPLLRQYDNVDIDVSTHKGLVAVATGTPSVGVYWNL